jgi:hypothetical protein
MILDHALDVQVFNGDCVKLLDQSGRCSVVKMLARSCYRQMCQRDFLFSFSSIRGTFLFLTQASLLFRQVFSCVFDETRIFNLAAIAQRGERGQACVAADAPKLIGLIRFDNAMKVNIGSSLELYRALGSSTELPMAPLAYSNANATLYGLLVTRSTFTPASASTVTLALHLKLGE